MHPFIGDARACSRRWGHCSCDGVFNAHGVGRRRGSLWTCHIVADIADVLPTSMTWVERRAAGTERRRAEWRRAGNSVRASRRVEAGERADDWRHGQHEGAMLTVGDGEDDVLAMIIMMGGLDRSSRPLSWRCVGISGRNWLGRRATGERQDVGSGVQASVGASAARCRRARAIDDNSMGGLDRPIQALPATENEGSSIWENDGWMRLRRKCLAIKMNLLVMSEEDSPRVATVINVGLRPRRIWNVLIVFVVMNDFDGPTGCSAMVGFVFFVDVGGEREPVVDGGRADGSFNGMLGRWLSASGNGFIGGSHGCRPMLR
ncbi:hypothetical protein ACLOJK_003682 [Asimina triloba]